MKYTLCIIVCCLVSLSLNAQNLILNSSFEQNLDPYCAGWFTACNKEISCDSNGDCSTLIYKDSPGDTLIDKWCLLVYGNTWPFENYVDYYVTGRTGTFIYQLKLWMNTKHMIGYGRLGVLDKGVFVQKDSVTDLLQPWTEYLLEDTLTTTNTDTIVVRLAAGIGDFCICDVYFDQVELTVLDSLSTEVKPVSNREDFEVFPNPVENVLNIISDDNAQFIIMLLNGQGQIVAAQQLKGNVTTVDLTSLPSGIYFYKIYSVKNTAIMKVGKLVKT